MNDKTLAIFKTPTVELTKEEVFESVPIEARLVKGVSDFKFLVQRQRMFQDAAAAENPEDVFDMRIAQFDNGGSLKLTFSKTLELPENVEDLVVNAERRRLRRLQPDIKTDYEDDQEDDYDDE